MARKKHSRTEVIWEELDHVSTPDGARMSLWSYGREFGIWIEDEELMSSHEFGSEEAIARLACRNIKCATPRVLIGGLGMGFTLRAALDVLPEDSVVVVAELMPAVLDWNNNYLSHLADYPMEDPRVKVIQGDVVKVMVEPPGFDAIILDVDNGPQGMTQNSNNGLYSLEGLLRAKSCLLDGGILAVWSNGPDRHFELRLAEAGFECETFNIRCGRKKNKIVHSVFLARMISAKTPHSDQFEELDRSYSATASKVR